MPRDGTWYISSESDPRWNNSGRDFWDCFSGLCPEAERWIEKTKELIGEDPPGDLMYGFYKD